MSEPIENDSDEAPEINELDTSAPLEETLQSDPTSDSERLPDDDEPHEHEAADHSVAPEIALPPFSGQPRGILRAGPNQTELVDAVAGRASVFGFGHGALIDALSGASNGYWGDGGLPSDDAADDAAVRPWVDSLVTTFGGASSIEIESAYLYASPDQAFEAAIGLVRRLSSGRRYRTIALVGSDHGRTGVCRIASGRPELHQGYGPMMAGFAHVPPGDLAALRAAIDEQTACVVLSPIQLDGGAVALESDYLFGVRELCDASDLKLIVDESRLVFGASGVPLTVTSLADIKADLMLVSAGIFGGLPGGILITSAGLAPDLPVSGNPVLEAVAGQTFRSMVDAGALGQVSENAQTLAVEIAQAVANFEFVRDVQATGMTIGIETDLPSETLVGIAAACGLRIESAGETAIRIQPPLVLADSDRERLLTRLGQMLEAAEMSAAQIETTALEPARPSASIPSV